MGTSDWIKEFGEHRHKSISPHGWATIRTWAVLSAAVALCVNVKSDQVSADAGDPQLTELARRVGDLMRQVANWKPENAAWKAAASRQDAAVEQLTMATDGEVEIHLRPGNQTVRHLRGRSLGTPAISAAPLAAADPHERIARRFFTNNHAVMRLANPDRELVLRRSERDEQGHYHLSFSQEFEGVPVWPAAVKAHFDAAGNLTLVEGAYVPTPELDSVKPRLSGEDAVARAKDRLASGRNAFTSDPDLIIYGPQNERPRLAWKFELTAPSMEGWVVVVDAQDGTILHRSPLICTGQVQGSGVDLSGTTRPLHVWEASNAYYLLDTSKPSYNSSSDPLTDPRGIIMVADADGASYDQVIQTGTANPVSSTTANLWPVPAAASAAFSLSETYDYYLERHRRNSFDGLGGNILGYVRVGNYDNAVWLGNLRFMVFGDTRPWSGSIDIVGHELTHGVTQYSAGLIGGNQTGALREAVSDIFGEMVEARTRGHNDWLLGSDFIRPLRNLKDPAALFYFDHHYPARMSEYIQQPNDENNDWGGIHVNSTIISHAFYLLAEGLTDAIGLRSAEAIFYRCLTQHLFAQSEFVDCRLGCIASAEELFGKDSTEARVTGQAFDAVEVFAAPTTPDPSPVPAVSGPDSLLFLYYDPSSRAFDLARREAALADTADGTLLTAGVQLTRPTVTGDGSTALFVNPDFDLCAVTIAQPGSRQCLGLAGLVYSVAISPDARLAAFVLRDQQTGQPQNKITLLDLAAQKSSVYTLLTPAADGAAVDTVLHADAMTFSTDGTTLFYDALSQLKFGNGPTVQRWSIYSLHLDSGQTSMLVPPRDGVDTGNPAVGRAGNRYVTYDSLQAATGVSSIMVLDLFTGQTTEVATSPGGYANPNFLGDESGVVYSVDDPNAIVTGRSLLKQPLTSDRLHSQGESSLWYRDASLGVVYRRGVFQATNALPTVTLQLSADQVPAQGSVTLTATAADADGTLARVEFYDGSSKLGQAQTAPFNFEWQNVPAGNHLVIARAVDDVGGTKDSAPRFLTAAGGRANQPPTVTLRISADTTTTQDPVTLTATAQDPAGSIVRVEFYADAVKLGEVTTAPYTLVWQNIPAGNHLLKARALDNSGAATDSSIRFLTVSGAPPPKDDRPKIGLTPKARDTVRLTVSGPPGDYIITMSEDLRTWVDIYPVTVDASGVGTVDDSGGPLHYKNLFYRVRRD
jgi:Zn-dependent metalloprotease